jgi:hypothetical protein
MPEVKQTFNVKDEFSKALDKFSQLLDRAAGSAERLQDNSEGASAKVKDISEAAYKSSGSFGGLGGSMIVLNQAMQAFTRLAEPVKQALDDISEKQRALVVFGHDAGIEFNEFAHNIALSTGRAEGEIRRFGMKWRNIGVGGNNIKELTELADRFANLNPGREFSDVAETFADAIKSKSTSGLAELLGGGEGVELKLQRGGVERALRRGDVSGAMDKFKQIADGFGFTQQKADQMGDTIDRKIQKIANIGRNYITSAFSDVVHLVEPYITKFLGWLQSDDVQEFVSDLRSNLGQAAAAVIALVDTVVEGWKNIYDAAQPVFSSIYDVISSHLSFIKDESVSLTDMLVGLFVGTASGIVFTVIKYAQLLWNSVVDMADIGSDLILSRIEYDVNIVLTIFRTVKRGVLTIIDSLITEILQLFDKLSGTDLGDFLGINTATEGLRLAAEAIRDIKSEKAEPFRIERHNFEKNKVDVIDNVKMTAESIEAALEKVHGIYDKSQQDNKKFNNYLKDALGSISDDTKKLSGLAQKEQDLRWMKEMAEQKFINEINLRQLTPTINLQVKGTTNQTPNDYAKSLAIELQKMADAGTFNAYGNVG